MTLSRRQSLLFLGSAATAAFIPWQGQAQRGLPPLRGYLRTNWSRDPFSYGSYSHIARGASRADHRALDAQEGGGLFFAGEAVHPERNSTVHAAHESGLRAAEQILETNARSALIIGAGMAGLTAAKRLSDRGLEVRVLEARNRMGGRILTNEDLGMPLDLGASWIHGTRGNPLTGLARRANMRTVRTRDSYQIWANGAQVRDRDAPDWLDSISIQTSYGADQDQLSGEAFSSGWDYGGAEVIFPGGYAPIFSNFVGGYEVRLNTEVQRVSWGQSPGVTLRNGQRERADAVLVTVPLGVLKTGRMSFSPELPQRKRQAINRLGMGTLDKLYLLFDQVFWPTEPTWLTLPETNLPPGQFNEWMNLQPYVGAPMLLAFNGGSAATGLAHFSDQALVAKSLSVLRDAF